VGKTDCWYDTILAYPAGIFFSLHKNVIVPFLKKKYAIKLFGGAMLVAIFRVLPYDYFCLKFNILSIIFALLIIQLSMKIKIQNAVLCWLGLNLFPLYIYQRIPMFLFSEINCSIVRDAPFLFMAASFIITSIIAHFYRYWQIRI
jgi:hypothetical protein